MAEKSSSLPATNRMMVLCVEDFRNN